MSCFSKSNYVKWIYIYKTFEIIIMFTLALFSLFTVINEANYLKTPTKYVAETFGVFIGFIICEMILFLYSITTLILLSIHKLEKLNTVVEITNVLVCAGMLLTSLFFFATVMSYNKQGMPNIVHVTYMLYIGVSSIILGCGLLAGVIFGVMYFARSMFYKNYETYATA